MKFFDWDELEAMELAMRMMQKPPVGEIKESLRKSLPGTKICGSPEKPSADETGMEALRKSSTGESLMETPRKSSAGKIFGTPQKSSPRKTKETPQRNPSTSEIKEHVQRIRDWQHRLPLLDPSITIDPETLEPEKQFLSKGSWLTYRIVKGNIQLGCVACAKSGAADRGGARAYAAISVKVTDAMHLGHLRRHAAFKGHIMNTNKYLGVPVGPGGHTLSRPT